MMLLLQLQFLFHLPVVSGSVDEFICQNRIKRLTYRQVNYKQQQMKRKKSRKTLKENYMFGFLDVKEII